MIIPTPASAAEARADFEEAAQQLGIEPRRFLLSPTGSYVDVTVSGAWHFFMAGALAVMGQLKRHSTPLQ
jgi:hypothetical protein